MLGNYYAPDDPDLYKGDVWGVGLIGLEMLTKAADHKIRMNENQTIKDRRILDETKQFERIPAQHYSP